MGNTLVDSDHFIAGVHVHFHRVGNKAPAGGLVRFDGIIRKEIEHCLALILGYDELERKKARPVVVRIQRGAEGVKGFVVFHLLGNKFRGAHSELSEKTGRAANGGTVGRCCASD